MARRTRITAKNEEEIANVSALDEEPVVNYRRPRTREECAIVPRPCPFVGCRYHLYLDETEAGNVYINFPDTPVLEMQHSCILDLAEKGPWSLRETSQILGLTPERIRQIELGVIEKLRYTDLANHKPEGRRTSKQYTMTHLLLNPKCKALIHKCLHGKLELDRLYQALLSLVHGQVSLVKLRGFIAQHKRRVT